MAMNFEHETLGQRVYFGAGDASKNLLAAVTELKAESAMVICRARERPLAQKLTADINVEVWHNEVVMHVPAESAATARERARENAVDLIISIGGGSASGLAKAIALSEWIAIIAIPTTYAGSEATNVWGITDEDRKTTGVDSKVLPVAMIYDSALTLSLSTEMSVASGLNAVAHCIDSLWAPKADPINAALAVEGIRALASGLQPIVADPRGIPGRDEVLYGAYLAAVSFASAGSGFHHNICHVLGGTSNLPHAQTHATVLPYVSAFNAPFAPEIEKKIAAASGAESALAGLQKHRV